MRVVISVYILLSIAIVVDCVFRPYGAPEFSLMAWWPVISALVVAAVGFASLLKALTRGYLPVVIAFLLSGPIASITATRNSLFMSGVTGVVTNCYVGGHGLKAIEVREPQGDLFRVEGLPASIWEGISAGDPAVKKPGSFDITVSGRVMELSRDGEVRREAMASPGQAQSE